MTRIDDIRQHAEEIQALQDAASPDWTAGLFLEISKVSDYDRRHIWSGSTMIGSFESKFIDGDKQRANAILTVAARNSTLPADAKWLCKEVEKLKNLLAKLAYAADGYSADQSRATDPRCGLVQPVTVAEAELLNVALKESWDYLKRAADAAGGDNEAND